MIFKTAGTILEENTSVLTTWASDADADRAMAYIKTHEPGQTALVWALSRVMHWREAYVACFAYVAWQIGVASPAITFVGDFARKKVS